MTLSARTIAWIAPLLFLFGATPAFAAILSVSPSSVDVAPGERFTVTVVLDTRGEAINAVEGRLVATSGAAAAEEASDGDSVVNIWIERPHVRPDGSVGFAGITPGGFRGQDGKVFSATFLAKSAGKADLELRDVRLLKDGGLGAAADVSVKGARIVDAPASAAADAQPAVRDAEPPEAFRPEIGWSPSVFDGEFFLSFATQDKGSGIDHYEVCESGKRCETAESPYLLGHQAFDADISVKAYDKSGNVRIESLSPQKPTSRYQNAAETAILASIILLAVAFAARPLWLKMRKKSS